MLGYMLENLETGDGIFVLIDNSDPSFSRFNCSCPCPWPHVHPAIPPWEWEDTQWVNKTDKCLPKSRSGRGWFDRCRN